MWTSTVLLATTALLAVRFLTLSAWMLLGVINASLDTSAQLDPPSLLFALLVPTSPERALTSARSALSATTVKLVALSPLSARRATALPVLPLPPFAPTVLTVPRVSRNLNP